MIPEVIPSTHPIDVLLSHCRGKRALAIEWRSENGAFVGNNGDVLILRVFYRLLGDLGIHVVSDPREADLLVVPGGGIFLEVYDGIRLLGQRLAELPDLPLVIFPQSAWLPHTDPTLMFGKRSAPTLWLLRERHSLEHLATRWGAGLAAANVSLALSHDVVAEGRAHVRRALDLPPRQPKGRRRLVVARLDCESGSFAELEFGRDAPPAPGQPSSLLASAYRRMPVPSSLRRSVARRRRRWADRDRQAAANRRLLAAIGEADATDDPVRRDFDIADPNRATYEQFARAIDGAAEVVSNRLHVCLAAAFLGKPTVIVDAGYHKLTGVYENSLADLPNVTFVRPEVSC